jgi:peptide/nickel transport system substrate-binding protein
MKAIHFMFVFLCLITGIGMSHGQCRAHEPEQVLVMGAQRDFMLAAEGKLLVFESLVNLDASGNPQPGLAESWEISEDGMTLTFFLRPGVTFHDGTLFNAKCAKFALERTMAEEYWAKYIDGIEILDEHTLQMHFNTYFNTFLLHLARGWNSQNFVSPEAVDPPWDPAGAIVRYMGTGPFKLVEYEKERGATLIRNENYWGETPKLSKILWKYTPDPYAQILALKAGELDIIGAPEHHSSVPFMKLQELASDPDLTVSIQSYGRYQVLEFNCQSPPFDEEKVRKAMNFAIDRETMVRSLFGDITDPSYLITDPKFPWGPSNIREGYGYDPARARSLLREAGWVEKDENGILRRNGKPFEIELLVPTGEANGDMVSLIVQSQLKKVGVDLKIKTLINGWEKRLSGEYDLFLHHSGCLPSIPGGIGIGGKYHSKGWPYAFHSRKLDALIESAFTTMDESLMRQKCNEIWSLLHDKNPCIPLYDIVKAVVMNKRVKNFRHGNTMFRMDLNEVEIVE